MPSITYIEFDGTAHLVEAEVGISLMEAAVDNNVPGILAECGGACACATCHVHIEESWLPVIDFARGIELELLEFVSDYREESRLACQIEINENMDGLVLRLPESQG